MYDLESDKMFDVLYCNLSITYLVI
jgi:hypothetical protein